MEKVKESKKIISYILIFCCIVLSILRIALNFKMAYFIRPDFGSDDGLLFNYAQTLRKFKWLGNYDWQTLVKGISYPLFLAFCAKASLPYPLMIGCLDVLAAGIFVYAIKEKCSNDIVLKVVYMLLLFNPIGLDFLARQRLYRNSLVPNLAVIVFSFFIGAFLRRKKELKTVLLWNICGGISLSFFYYLREDSVWIMPFIIVVTILNIVDCFLLQDKEQIFTKESICRACIFLIPFIMFVVFTNAIKIKNNKEYGVFLINDRSGSYFADTMSDLYKIDAKNENYQVWVSRDAMNIALENSTTLRTIESELREKIKAWGGGEEVKGDLISWCIRNAASDKGLYTNAKTANDFWKKVHIELKDAYKAGKIKKKSGIFFTKQATGIKFGEITMYMGKTFENIEKISRYSECEMHGELPVFPDAAKIRKYEVDYGVYAPLQLNTEDPMMQKSEECANFSNNVIKKYKFFAIPINVVAILSYILLTACVIYQFVKRKYANLEMWLMTTGVGLSVFLLCMGVTFFTSWFPKDMEMYIRPFYSAGAYSVIQIFKYMSIIFGVIAVADIIKTKIFVKTEE